MTGTRRIVLLALFVSQALVLSVIESWIPIPVAIPGVKLGLANIITLIVIMFFGFRQAIAVVVLRTVLSSLFGGGLLVLLFSITGGLLSTVVMAFLYKRMPMTFSIVGISIVGAIAHNVGQIFMASLIMREVYVLFYLPVLAISGVVMGCFVGICTNLISKALDKTKILYKLR